MYGSVDQAFVGRDEPKNGCEGGLKKSGLQRSPGQDFKVLTFSGFSIYAIAYIASITAMIIAYLI